MRLRLCSGRVPFPRSPCVVACFSTSFLLKAGQCAIPWPYHVVVSRSAAEGRGVLSACCGRCRRGRVRAATGGTPCLQFAGSFSRERDCRAEGTFAGRGKEQRTESGGKGQGPVKAKERLSSSCLCEEPLRQREGKLPRQAGRGVASGAPPVACSDVHI